MKQGRIYLMTESISQLYRAGAPIHPWFIYLLEAYEGPEKVKKIYLIYLFMNLCTYYYSRTIILNNFQKMMWKIIQGT